MASLMDNLQKLLGKKEFEEQVKKIRSAQLAERNKTQKLREQLTEKEEQVEELERKVLDNEKQMGTLQEEISGNREVADQLIIGVTIQIQEMIDKLNEQMELLDNKTERQLQQISEKSEQQLQQINEKSEQQLQQIGEKSDQQLQQIGEQSGQQMLSVNERLGQLDEIRASLEQIRDLKAAIDKLEELQDINDQLAVIYQSVREDGKKVDELRADVGEKIHSENVKCYRNMKSLITDLDGKFRQVDLSEDSVKAVKGSFTAWKVFSFFAVIDCAGIVFIILHMLNLI